MKILDGVNDLFDNEYSAYIKCTNCDRVYLVAISQGLTVNDYLEKETCPNCGCQTMVKR